MIHGMGVGGWFLMFLGVLLFWACFIWLLAVAFRAGYNPAPQGRTGRPTAPSAAARALSR